MLKGNAKLTSSMLLYLEDKRGLAGDGRIQSRSYENQEGRRIFVTEVVADSVQFLEPKMLKVANVIKVITMISKTTVKFGGQQSGQNTSYNNNNSSNNKQSDNPFANANGPIDISDDDLPF